MIEKLEDRVLLRSRNDGSLYAVLVDPEEVIAKINEIIEHVNKMEEGR